MVDKERKLRDILDMVIEKKREKGTDHRLQVYKKNDYEQEKSEGAEVQISGKRFKRG